MSNNNNQNNPDMWASLLSAATMSDPVDAQNNNNNNNNGGGSGGGGREDGGGNIGAGMSPAEYHQQQHPSQGGGGGGYQLNNNPDGVPPGGQSRTQYASPFGLEDLQQYRQYPSNMNNNDNVAAYDTSNAGGVGGPESFHQREQYFQQQQQQQPFEEDRNFRMQQQYQQQQDHQQYQQNNQDQYREEQIRQQFLQQQQSLDHQHQRPPSDRRTDDYSFGGRVMELNDDVGDDRLRSFDNREMQAPEQLGASHESNNGGGNDSNVFNPIETDNMVNEMGGRKEEQLCPPTNDSVDGSLNDDVGSPTMDLDDPITKGKDDDFGGSRGDTPSDMAMVNHPNEDKMVDPFSAPLDDPDDEMKNVTNNQANAAPNIIGGIDGEDEQKQPPMQEEIDVSQKDVSVLEEQKKLHEEGGRQESGKEEKIETEEEQIRREEEIHFQKEEEEQKRLEDARKLQEKDEEQRRMEEELRRLEEEEFQRQQQELERQEEEEKKRKEEGEGEQKQQIAEAADLVGNERDVDMQQKKDGDSPPKELEEKQQKPTETTAAPESNEAITDPSQPGSEVDQYNELAKETEGDDTILDTSAGATSNDDRAENPQPTGGETKAEDDSMIQPISKEDANDGISTTHSPKVLVNDKQRSDGVVKERDQGTVEEPQKEKKEVVVPESMEQEDVKTTTAETKDKDGNAATTNKDMEKEDFFMSGPSETVDNHVAESTSLPKSSTEEKEANKADIEKNPVSSIETQPNEEGPTTTKDAMEIDKPSLDEIGEASDILETSSSAKENKEEPTTATEPMEIDNLSPKNDDKVASDILATSTSAIQKGEGLAATTEPMEIDDTRPQDTITGESETKESKESTETPSGATKDLTIEEVPPAKPITGESISSPLAEEGKQAEPQPTEASKDEVRNPTTEPKTLDAPSSKDCETGINSESIEDDNKGVAESSPQVAEDDAQPTTNADAAESEQRSILPAASNKEEMGINKASNENNEQNTDSSSLLATNESMKKDHTKSTTTLKVGEGEKASDFPLEEGYKEKEIATEPPKVLGPLTPNQLYLNRCDKCDLCLKPDCQQCTSCFNSSFLKKSRKQACFRKMCCNIEIVKKAQPMPKFPGYYFWFDKPSESSSSPKSDLQGLFLSNPEGKHIKAEDFTDLTSTKELASVFPKVDSVQSKLSDFYQYIGFLNSQRKRRSVNYTQDDLEVMEEDDEDEKEQAESPLKPKPTKKRSATANSAHSSKRRKTSGTTKSKPSQSDDIRELPPPEKDDVPEIGDRVYSCFDDDDNWYWGKVTDKFKKGDSYHYSIQYDDGDYIEDFDPLRGIATEAHYKAGMVPDDPEACRLDDGTVEQKSASSWVAKIDYARKSRFLGTFRTKQEAKKYLGAVKEILESFGKTRLEVSSMTDTQGRKAVQRARYEAESLLGIPSKKGGDDKPEVSASNKRKRESSKRKPGGGAKPKKANANENKKSLEKIIQDSLKSLDESSKAGSKEKAEETSKARPKMKAGKSTGTFQNSRPKMQAAKSTYQGKTRAAVEYQTDSNILRELYSCRCKNCVCCCLSACGRCEPCLRNKECDDETRKEVCLRKMCCKIDVDKKALKATGFPQGWRFFFDKPRKTMSVHLIEDYVELDGLRLLAPNGRKYTSVQKAINHNPTALSNFEEIAKFYKIIGQPMYHEDNQHILIGRGVCQEWTDLHNRKKIVYGVITHAEKKGDGDEADFVFTVQYNENSNALANSLPNACGSSVPSTKFLKSELAWGGCLNFEDKRRPLNRKRPLRSFTIPIATWDWITPDMRYEELGDTESNKLPKLTLGVRGYQLVFTVKQSSIPNSGLGVFVKATKCVDGPKGEPFELKQGEMLDLGIYAPFLATDKKKEPAFFVKNFIHSFATEEWGFDTVANDSMFDITDDHSGKIHEQAKRHLPAYVNECSSKNEPTVRAEHDPEGNVHYLLGVLDAKKLSIPVNADGVEIFVNYGPHYENVRLRKGYSELPAEEQTKRLEKLAKEDLEYLNDVDNFSAEDVSPCLVFFENFNFQNTSELVRQRSLKILKVLDERCQKILDSEAEGGEKIDLHSCRNRIKSLSSQLRENTTQETGSYVLDLDQIDSSLENREKLTETMHPENVANLQEPTEKMLAEENEHRPAQEELQPGGLESTTTEANTTEAGTHGENLFPSQDNGNSLGQQELQLGGLDPFTAFPDDTPGTQNLE